MRPCSIIRPDLRLFPFNCSLFSFPSWDCLQLWGPSLKRQNLRLSRSFTEDRSDLYIFFLYGKRMWFAGLEQLCIYEMHNALQEKENVCTWVKKSTFVSVWAGWPRVSDVPFYWLIVWNRSEVLLTCVSCFREQTDVVTSQQPLSIRKKEIKISKNRVGVRGSAVLKLSKL